MTTPGNAIPTGLMDSRLVLSSGRLVAKRRGMCRAVIGMCLLLCLLLDQTAVAQKIQLPVRMKLEPLSIRGRSGGPIPVQIKLEYNRNQIMEGDLVLRIHNSVISNDDMVASIRYEGIVLQGTDYIFKTVLPPIEHSFAKLYQITAWFETDTERIPLTSDPDQITPPAPHDLLSIAGYERSTLMCSSSGERNYLKPSNNRAFLNNRLSLANYNAPKTGQPVQADQINRRPTIDGVQDYAVNWDALELPEDPLHYCCFDVVLLADGATSRLNESQMQALLTWVRAGGSLCVLPDDIRLNRSHLQFLQTLFERDDDPGLHLSITDENTLLVITDKQTPIINRHLGVGRVTLLPNLENLSQRMTDEQVGLVTGHLWKVRSNSPILKGEPWLSDQNIKQLLEQNGYQISGQPGNFNVVGSNGNRNMMNVGSLEEVVAGWLLLDFHIEPKANPLNAAAETALLPEGIRMVPTWVIAVLLIAYVVAIGPVDYLVLGFFRARKYTWILFPLVTAAFTALTINIAHRYMSSSDSGGRMTIVDVGEQGTALRKTDVQMHFYAAATQVTKDASQTFTVPAQMMTSQFDQFGGVSAPRPATPAMSYSGRFPQSYTTEQSMRQWEPQTVRTLTLAPEGLKVPDIDWDNLELVTTSDGRQKLAATIRQLRTSETQIDAIVLNGDKQFPLFFDGFMFSSQNLAAGRSWVQLDQRQRRYQEPNHAAVAVLGVLESAALSGRNDFFDIVSQVSPHGSASMEDLPVLDKSDELQWMLMIAVKQQTSTEVYRKMYHTSLPRLIAVD